MASTNDPIVELSLLLKKLPFDFQIERYSGPEGGYSVTLHNMIDAIHSDPANGTGPTFALAYAVAVNKMSRMSLVSVVDEMTYPIEVAQ